MTLKGHQAYVRAIALLQDQKHLVSGSYDTTMKIWEIATGVCQSTFTGHTKPVLAVSVLPWTENICISGGEDAVIKAWNWKEALCVWKIELDKNEVWSLQNAIDLTTNTFAVMSGHKYADISFILLEMAI
jgi:WD40 repeat protein